MFETEELEAIISDNVVSSTYLSMLHNRLRSSLCLMNENGPRSDPWGIPSFKKSHCEHGKPGTRTRWRLWDNNDLNHSHNNLGTDFWYNFFKRMLWSTKSNALRKSTKTVRTAWPVSRAVVHKSSAETSACKVDRPARQPNCCWSSWGGTRSSIHFLTNDSKILAAVGRSEIGRKSLDDLSHCYIRSQCWDYRILLKSSSFGQMPPTLRSEQCYSRTDQMECIL